MRVERADGPPDRASQSTRVTDQLYRPQQKVSGKSPSGGRFHRNDCVDGPSAAPNRFTHSLCMLGLFLSWHSFQSDTNRASEQPDRAKLGPIAMLASLMGTWVAFQKRSRKPPSLSNKVHGSSSYHLPLSSFCSASRYSASQCFCLNLRQWAPEKRPGLLAPGCGGAGPADGTGPGITPGRQDRVYLAIELTESVPQRAAHDSTAISARMGRIIWTTSRQPARNRRFCLFQKTYFKRFISGPKSCPELASPIPNGVRAAAYDTAFRVDLLVGQSATSKDPRPVEG